MTHRVLVTAVGGNVGQGVVKALRAGSRDYFIVGSDMDPRSAGFAMVDRACVVPGAKDGAALRGRLQAIIEADGVEAIFVCSPAELTFFSAHRRDLESSSGVRVLLAPDDVVETGRDKWATVSFLERHGFPYPETVLASDRAAVDRLLQRFGPRVVVKPRYGASSVDVRIVEGGAGVDAARALTADLVVQRWLPGDAGEFTSGVVGSVTGGYAAITLRRDLLQGTTYRTELCADAGLHDQMLALARALRVHGTCNFQFRLVDGQAVVFEINPRFSGTSGIRYLYGFNDPEMVFEHVCLGEPVRAPALRPGVVLRYWNEVHVPDATFESVDAAGGRVIHPARGRGGAARES